MTVALGLLAFKIAGDKAGAVLGTALAIKMVAYVGVAPVVGQLRQAVAPAAFLVAMDLVRAAVAVALPFVTEVWQVYVLIFVLQCASAAFTPTFQATIPDVLPEENDYTRALSLSRLAYDLESLLSPTLAAALLTLITFNWLFCGTVIGFLCSAALVVSVRLHSTAGARRSRAVILRQDDTRHPHLSRDAAAARVAGPEPFGCGGGCHGHRQHGRAGRGVLGVPTTTSRWRSPALAAARCWRRCCCRGARSAAGSRGYDLRRRPAGILL